MNTFYKSRTRGCLGCLLALTVLVLAAHPTVAQPPEGGGRGGPGEGRGGGRGGDREGGGGFRGGGPPGGGPPGGFDPTFILQRMDKNGNGKLDPDEVDGRAKFMLERFAPGIDTSRSVSFDDIKQKIQAAREGGGDRRGGDRSNRGGGGGGDRGGEGGRENEPNIVIEPLVPGFGEEIVLEPVLGFGGSGEFFAEVTTEADEAEADRTIDRYDRNKNGKLDRDEIRRARWYDDPTIYDQNGDGALSKRELSVRYAKRRVAKESENSDRDTRDRRYQDDDKNRNQDSKKDVAQDERKSYRFLTAAERLPDGIPSWFREKDIDLDGQIGMSEYAADWDDDTVTAFLGLDIDGNGLVSPDEALVSTSSSTSSTDSKGGDVSDKSTSASDSQSSKDNSEVPKHFIAYAEDTLKTHDQDKDGVLSSDEIAAMRWPPKKGADANNDGKISVEEYARSMIPKK